MRFFNIIILKILDIFNIIIGSAGAQACDCNATVVV